MKEEWTYKRAGVDVEAGEHMVEKIKEMVHDTHKGHGVRGELGGFGGVYESPQNGFLLATCDGVGTKVLIAQQLGVHNTVGIDLVAMSVNDLLAQGGKPLFFLDYIAIGRMEEALVVDLVRGITAGCRAAGCALLGGETAEMPDIYPPGVYDLAGFAVGTAQEEELLPRPDISAGDLLVGLPASGLHSNGFSLVRRLLLAAEGYKLESSPPGLDRSLGEELLEPTCIYTREVEFLRENYPIKGLAHITGGGLTGNIPRVLPAGFSYRLEYGQLQIPSIFSLVQKKGNIAQSEMLNTFNMGVGMVAVMEKTVAEGACAALNKRFYRGRRKSAIIGEVVG